MNFIRAELHAGEGNAEMVGVPHYGKNRGNESLEFVPLHVGVVGMPQSVA